MKKINVSADDLTKFAGKWVVVDPKIERVIAVSKKLSDISKLVMHSVDDKNVRPVGQAPYAFQVPQKGEGQYVL